MNCEACRGACCEDFYLPAASIRLPNGDARRWLELHGARDEAGLRIECRCTALTPAGRCGIYGGRPRACQTYQPGGLDCMETVRRRRTPEQYDVIREAGDPERIHEAAA